MSVQSRKRKVDIEYHVFNDKWCVEYFVIEKTIKALCVICNKLIAVLKEYNIRLHYKTKHDENFDKFKDKVREHKLETLERGLCFQQSIFKKRVQKSKEIAKTEKPFTDSYYIKNCIFIMLEDLFPDKIEHCKYISVSPNTVACRVEDITGNFSAIEFEVTEELADLMSLHGTTTGEDIFKEVQITLAEKYNLPHSRLKCVPTDGRKNMCGTNKNFIGRMNAERETSNVPKPLTLHCILHQEALCGKSVDISCVMNHAIIVVNFVRSHGLKPRQFKSFLEEVESLLPDLPYHAEVRWLINGKIFPSFFSLRTEVEIFLNEKERSMDILSVKKCLELIHLQANDIVKGKFKEGSLVQFYNYL
ncbi:hypothetical protein PR048_002128, partial [Dryococelus australis]